MARLHWTDPFWDGKRKPFVTAIAMSSLLLILLFFVNMTYLYGSLFNVTTRTKGINMLAVDYDGGLIGKALIEAYAHIKGDGFPTLNFRSATDFATIHDVQHAVCKGEYWAAIISQPGASNRLSDALGGGTPAAKYNSSDTLTYIYNEVHYSTVQQGFIVANMQTLIGIAGSVYNSLNGTAAARYLDTSDTNATLALLNPITASSINITPTSQGTRVLYNTVSLVLPIIQQFFVVMALNGVSQQFEIYGYLATSQVGLIRLILSYLYTSLGSLTTIGYIWMYRESWDVTGHQFALSWLAMWLYMHVNFLVMDTTTAFIPLQFMPFFVLSWAILNITSTIFPFELSAGFYRWGYALPGHQIVTILFQIWSRGCNNQLARALPVLFGWEVFGLAAAIIGSGRRNKGARQAILAGAAKGSPESTAPLEKDESSQSESPSTRKDGNGAKPGDEEVSVLSHQQGQTPEQFELYHRSSHTRLTGT